jgi:glycolate oxidase FAD binding subunit
MPEVSTLPAKRPPSAAEFAGVVAQAAAAGNRVQVSGSSSMPMLSFTGDERSIMPVSTLRMNKLLEHAVGDMMVVVEAGMSLEALQRQLAWQNQWLPVDPPVIGTGRTPGQRTIGGLIATNSLGPLRFGCGDWRLFIMGMRWVDGEGRLIRGGGRTVKNSAGYSSPRMMIGSGGSLGAIAEVTLRTFARPDDERCVIFYADTPARGEALLAEIMASATSPAYLEAVGARTFAGNPLQLPAGVGGGVIIIAGFLGRQDVCAAQVERVRDLPAARGMESIMQLAAQCGRLRLWLTSEPTPDAQAATFRLHARSSEVCALLADIEKDAGAWVVSEAGSGMVRGIARRDAVSAAAARCKEARVVWIGAADQSHISEVESRLKLALDPRGTFGSLLS